jgi:RND family efflux transporter MFP subunit
MAVEATTRNHELETLRIERPQEQPRRKRSRLISIAMLMVLAAILVAAGYVIYAKTIGRPPTVQTMMIVARRDGQPSVLLTGSGYIVTRHKYITIGTKILGQIVDEPIEEGQHIKAGDVLARIDDRDYQAQLRQAIAIRDVAKANLHLLQDKADRARRLIKSGAISTDDFEAAVTGAEVAQAELERDEAAVDYAKFNVNQCVISSPINGIVLKKYRELGDTINFGGQIQAGGGATDIAQLADTDDMRAEVDINEADIAKVGIGSPVVVALEDV